MRIRSALLLVVAAALTLTACTGAGQPSAVRQDRETAAANLDRLNDAQPVPEFRWSQIRQNLIEINRSQAETTQTTSFFFNLGVAHPITVCPSIGFPIPTTAQLTNPSQHIFGNNGAAATIGQVEQTGIYTGDSTGTYVMCIDAQGRAYAQYWEGFVSTVAGPAEWDREAGTVRLIGPPSFEFSEGQS